LQPVELFTDEVPEMERVKRITETLDSIFKNLKIKRATDVDIYFMPLIVQQHVYLVVFDMNASQTYVIDNSAVDGDSLQKYDGLPMKLVSIYKFKYNYYEHIF
jgi:hypothetical protein